MNLSDFTTFIEQNRIWAAPVMLLLAFGESIAFISLILPFWSMLVAVGAAVGLMSAEFFIVWIAASVGAGLGDWVSYWLGYHFHDRIARMWPLSRYPDLMPRGHRFFEKYGVWAIVIGRFSGPFRATVPIIAGATEMNRVHFQLANWSSAFLWALVLMVFGGSIGEVISALWKVFSG